MEEELFPSDTALNTPIPHNCLHKIMHSQGFLEPVRVSVHTSYKKWQKSNIFGFTVLIKNVALMEWTKKCPF